MMDEHEYEKRALDLADRIPAMSDTDLVAVYQAYDAEADDPFATALADEIERRSLDI